VVRRQVLKKFWALAVVGFKKTNDIFVFRRVYRCRIDPKNAESTHPYSKVGIRALSTHGNFRGALHLPKFVVNVHHTPTFMLSLLIQFATIPLEQQDHLASKLKLSPYFDVSIISQTFFRYIYKKY